MHTAGRHETPEPACHRNGIITAPLSLSPSRSLTPAQVVPSKLDSWPSCPLPCLSYLVLEVVQLLGDLLARLAHVQVLALHPAPLTLHPAPYTLHPTTCNLHPAPCTLDPRPYTSHPEPLNLHPTPYTRTAICPYLVLEVVQLLGDLLASLAHVQVLALQHGRVVLLESVHSRNLFYLAQCIN